MLKRIWFGFLATAAVVAVTNCTEQPTAPRSADAGLAQLKQRVADMRVAYTGVGRLTPELRREVMRLKDDVERWQARTGRNEIAAAESRHVRDASAGEDISLAMRGDGGGGCNCEIIMFSRGRVCFLVACDPSIRMCSYVCFGEIEDAKLG
jgi:hypothetical protein